MIGDPGVCLEEITNMRKTIFINHFERPSVPKKSQELYRKSRDSSREPTMKGRETAMTLSLLAITIKGQGIAKKM